MAITKASTSSNTATAVSSLTITKPTGLAVGEVLVVCLFRSNRLDSTGILTTPAGWTLHTTQSDGGRVALSILYKTATSGDVAASNFTFTNNIALDYYQGFMFRLTTDTSFTSPVITSSDSEVMTGDGVTPTTTPTFPLSFKQFSNSLIIVASVTANDDSIATSGYTINGTNPTWTEHFDFATGDFATWNLVSAAPVASTDVTSYNYTTSTATRDAVASAIVIAEVKNASPDVDTIATPPTLYSITGSNTATPDVSHLDNSPTLYSPSSKPRRNNWRNQDKPNTNWNNLPK